jgi:hypothetical protein
MTTRHSPTMSGEARFGRHVAEPRQIADPRAFSRDTHGGRPPRPRRCLAQITAMQFDRAGLGLTRR